MPIPVNAIGGLNSNNIDILAGVGIHGVCVVSAIMKAPDPDVRGYRVEGSNGRVGAVKLAVYLKCKRTSVRHSNDAFMRIQLSENMSEYLKRAIHLLFYKISIFI